MSNPHLPQPGASLPDDSDQLQVKGGVSIPAPAYSPMTSGSGAEPSDNLKASYPADPPADRDVPLWEPTVVFLATLLALALLAPRIIAYLSPTTGDEPFYLMTAISILDDHDINECDNYRQRDEAKLYPPSVSQSHTLPAGWVGWATPPYPLPPHPAKIEPASRRCLGSDVQANYIVPDTSWPLPADGTQSELYSKHGLGLSLLVAAPFGLGGRDLVVFFLNILGALVAVNIYLFARQATGRAFPALLTWLAFSFTLPIMPYSYLIFPELPAALLVIYAFRRIWLGHNNSVQLFLVGLCIAFMPWLHYRFAPVSAGLALFYLAGLFRNRYRPRRARLIDASIVFLPVVVAAVGLMSYFYFLYHIPFPNGSDHAGISDVAGTVRGAAGSFIDEQWGLFTAAPVYILAVVGLIWMAFAPEQRRNLLWMGVVALPYFLVIANYAQWWGEWCPPARYLTSILPLLAIPFSYVLARLSGVRALVYGIVYAALTFVSYLATWGFVTQPQWLYNQPNGQAQLLLKGLPQLLGMLPSTLRPNLNLVDNLPSFVIPYFAYLLKGKAVGDQWADIAWQKSVMPLTVVGIIVAFGLVLAFWEWRVTRARPGSGGDGASTTGFRELPVYGVAQAEPGADVRTAAPHFRLSPVLAFPASWGATGWRLPVSRGALVWQFAQDLSPRPLRPARPSPLVDPEKSGASSLQDTASGGARVPAGVDQETTPRASLLLRIVPIALGLIALGLGLYGQKLVMDHQVVQSIRWYALGILVMIVAWAGTYRNRSLVKRPPGLQSHGGPQESAEGRSHRFPWRGLLSQAWRYALALCALGLNVFAVGQLRSSGFSSVIGGWGWLASVLLLVVAFSGYKPAPGQVPDEDAGSVEERTDFRLSRWVELAVVVAIFALALGLRLYRLGDWTTGMHGDEGEAGTDALALLNGAWAPPFQTGWFEQPNFYYWGIALTMKVFGTDLFGLRMFSTLAGSLMVFPLYGLVKQWFGVRCAIIAGVLVAISDVAIHFSRQEFSNITTPLFLCTGFYFLFKGLRSGKVLHFILSAYASMLTVYFYMGGRLTPFLIGAALLYIFIVLPLVALPGQIRHLLGKARQEGIRLNRRQAAFRALRMAFGPLRIFAAPIAFGALACYMFAAPFLFYYLDNRAMLDLRTQDKLVFNNAQRMSQQYGITHDPLYLGLRVPRLDDILPPSPLVFEPTPVSVKIANDGFWPRAMWNQLTTTLSILTYHYDASSVYTFTGAPATKPIEAVLVIFGIAWALWRWRDTRMAVLSMWFWSTIIVGGVATIDAPYMARLVGIIPTLAIFGAITLNKCAAHLADVARALAPKREISVRVGKAVTAACLLAVLGYLAFQNAADYYGKYVASYPFTLATGQAVFVRNMNAQAAEAGRPTPHYYNLGAPLIYWTYGVNRFLNFGVTGVDVQNPSDVLPLTADEGHDAIFILWDPYKQYLPVLQQYYPDGETIPFHYSADPKADPIFTAFRVTPQAQAAHRFTLAAYTPRSGPTITRHEKSLGTSAPPPPTTTYPARVNWSSQVIAPAFAHYTFGLAAPAGASLKVDGASVLTATTTSQQTTGDLILARGPHDVSLDGTLLSSSDSISLTWKAGLSHYAPVAGTDLWQGAGRGLLAEVSPGTAELSADSPADSGASTGAQVVSRRIDGFLGFKLANTTLANGPSLTSSWQGVLEAPRDGPYTFEVSAISAAVLSIDGRPVVDTRQGDGGGPTAASQVMLSKGPHNFLLRYNWNSGAGLLEVYWTPPNAQKSLLGPDVLHATGGSWLPGTIAEPPDYAPSTAGEASPPGPPVSVKKIIGAPGDLLNPRGVGVDSAGRVYVGDRGHYRVVVFGPDGKVLRSWGQAAPPERAQSPGEGDFVDISDLAVSANGTVYVLDNRGQWLQVFDSDGHFIRKIDIGKLQMFSPSGLDVGPDGIVYVADTGQNRVVAVGAGDAATSYRADQGNQDGIAKLNQPVDVAFSARSASNPSDIIYSVDMGGRVVRILPDGHIDSQWSLAVGFSDGGPRITVMPDGRLCLTDPDGHRLVIVDPASGRVSYSGQDQFGALRGIASGADGLLYVADSDKNEVLVLSIGK